MVRLLLSIVMAFAVMAFSSGNLYAGGSGADLKLGAQLYDNWPKINKVKTEGNHPLYPAASKKKGSSTWRCKECHGWDYIGKDGRYKKGSHYTGIKGVYGARGKSAVELKGALSGKGGAHDFSKYLSGSDIAALAKFMREGLVDINTALDAGGKPKGDRAKGKAHFNKVCAMCHGKDGDMLDFKKKKEGKQGVAWASEDNPHEILHKIRWGHPGSKMPSVITDKKLSDSDAVDILTYGMTLKLKPAD